MTESRRALITGITGQDGSYLAEYLLAKGYEVHGIMRRVSGSNLERLQHFAVDGLHDAMPFHLHYGDLTDTSSLRRVIEAVQPTEIYNLAAQSHVRVSFDVPEYTLDTIARGTTSLLESLRQSGVSSRFYQASSSEMFGRATEELQSETSPFYPRSPYAAAKIAAHEMARVYREAYGLHISCGILFNHESPRRGPTFVSRKVTRSVAAIVAGREDALYLGNLEARRDWGYAPEYVEAMWLMLQQPEPDDYVIATGETHSVRDFAEEAFRLVGLDAARYVRFDPFFLRPAEVDVLRGDFTKARERLGWEPRTHFHELVRLMLAADLEAAGLSSEQSLAGVTEGGP